MKISIMQPYLFPYIGYFQLIHSVDKFIIYDDVNYTKGGWINRNKILINHKPFQFILPICEASQNKKLNQLNLFNGSKEKGKMLKTFERAYKRTPEFKNVMPLLKDIMENNENNLTKFIEQSLIKISAYLDIRTDMIKSSMFDKKEGKGQEQIIDICKLIGAAIYINAIGGQSLYNKGDFKKHNIDLYFIKMGDLEFRDNYSSIIDILFLYDKEHIKRQIVKYELI